VSAIAKHGPASPQTYHVLVSHVHWDHIMGFPFFVPAFIPGNRIRIYSCHAKLEQAIRGQNAAPCFPVEFAALGAKIEFIALEPGRPYEIGGATVTGNAQRHGGDSTATGSRRTARAWSIPPTRSTRWRTSLRSASSWAS
jgi:phosphoribosyl 1,2-cyclic phosphodiesterase